MRIIEKFQTFDGVAHDTVEQARQHLDVLQGDILFKITCAIANSYTDAYNRRDEASGVFSEFAKARQEVKNYIMDNLELFNRLRTIQDDNILIED